MSVLVEKIHAYHKDLSPAKVARKYKLLIENPFRFFRGTNNLFYEDLAKETIANSPLAWICGDLHIENFGSYKGDNRLVYFDLNDFDESILAPVLWEIIRMLTSVLVAFDALKITNKEAVEACAIYLKKYAQVLGEGNPRYIETRTASGITKAFLRSVETRSELKLLESKTVKKKGILRLSHGNNKQLAIDKATKEKLFNQFKIWMKSNNKAPNNYKVLDVRFRLAGTGSIGIRRYVFLIKKVSDPDKYMLIDMKQATPSSLLPYLNSLQPSWESEAKRMVFIQKMMQNIPPAQLSTLDFEGESYLMQELQPLKDRINFEMIQHDFKKVCSVIEDMAMITASAHLRGAGRKGSAIADDLIAFGNSSKWQKDALAYAIRYKERVIENYQEFKEYFKTSRKRRHGKIAHKSLEMIDVDFENTG